MPERTYFRSIEQYEFHQIKQLLEPSEPYKNYLYWIAKTPKWIQSMSAQPCNKRPSVATASDGLARGTSPAAVIHSGASAARGT